MKKIDRENRHYMCSAIIAVIICVILLLQIYLESACARYASRTYNLVPLYGVRAAFCLLWALGVRMYIAIRRKKEYVGKIMIVWPAVILVVILLAIGAIDYTFGVNRLISNQVYEVMLSLAVLCCVMRKKE